MKIFFCKKFSYKFCIQKLFYNEKKANYGIPSTLINYGSANTIILHTMCFVTLAQMEINDNTLAIVMILPSH